MFNTSRDWGLESQACASKIRHLVVILFSSLVNYSLVIVYFVWKTSVTLFGHSSQIFHWKYSPERAR